MSRREALELIADGAEVAFKQTVENSLLKDIPIVSSDAVLFKSTSFGSTYQRAHHYGWQVREQEK
jgi:hypothetical protein